MRRSLFLTGGSGLIGSHLLRRLSPEKYKTIYCLSRDKMDLAALPSHYSKIKLIRGGIFDANAYLPYLEAADVVVHLAAATGKAKPDEYFKVNAEGTQFLVKQCQQQGVPNFLYISSIAVKFQDKSRYHYAQSKELSEAAVKESALNYAILRPTMVIGREAPIWQRLSKLAMKPLVPMFGNGEARIQPIYIDDLVDCILFVIEKDAFQKETWDLGGPEILSFESFIKRIHQVYNRRNPAIIRLPLQPLMAIFSWIEKRFDSLLPFNVGQLSSFYQDGTIETNWLFEQHAAKMKTVDEMLELVTNHA
jgi:NADH dehydrogenase